MLLDLARGEVLYGQGSAATQTVRQALRLSDAKDVKQGAARVMVLTGKERQAQKTIHDLLRDYPADTFLNELDTPLILAAISRLRFEKEWQTSGKTARGIQRCDFVGIVGVPCGEVVLNLIANTCVSKRIVPIDETRPLHVLTHGHAEPQKWRQTSLRVCPISSWRSSVAPRWATAAQSSGYLANEVAAGVAGLRLAVSGINFRNRPSCMIHSAAASISRAHDPQDHSCERFHAAFSRPRIVSYLDRQFQIVRFGTGAEARRTDELGC